MNLGSFIFKQARITDPESQHNGSIADVFVQDGKIVAINPGNQLPGETVEIDLKGASLAPGIFDMQVCSGQPGYEEKERMAETIAAAIAGGVTDFLLMPGLNPVSDHRSQLAFLYKLAEGAAANVHAAGSLSVAMKGEALAELFDMRQGGALAFTDDKSPVENTVLLHLALQYVKVSGGMIMLHCEDPRLRLGGQVNEGASSTLLGLKGTPAISEELGVMRALTLARYHDQNIHLSGISSKGAVELIRAAKKEGIRVSCSVYAHHLYFTDDVLQSFDSHYKVWPPLRTEADRMALLEGLEDNTIDVICSDHRPHPIESKDVEFDFAAFGMRGLETLFGATFHSFPHPEKLIRKLCLAPRQLLGLPIPSISEGREARFFVYGDAPFKFEASMIKGRSLNSPFVGKDLRGRIWGTFTPTGGWQAFTGNNT